MSFTLELIINPVLLSLAVIGGALVGFVFGKGKLAKAHSTIHRLESDLMSSNQETLEAQQALVALEAQVQEQQAIPPVIPMKINGKENSKEKASNK